MVAGMSSRFGGRIKQFAKVTEDKTLIEYSLDQALKSGFSKIIFIVGNLTEEPFKKKFGDSYNGIPVFYALQKFNPEVRDKPWGTTDAVCSIKEIIDCPFVICNGDDIYGENTFRIAFECLKNKNECSTIGYQLLEVLPETGTVNRGIFESDNGYATKITETFNISKLNFKELGLNENSLCSQNIFSMHPEIVKLLNAELIKFKEKNAKDRKIECLLPAELSKLINQGDISMRLHATPDKWIGITNPEDEEVVRNLIRNSINSFKKKHQ